MIDGVYNSFPNRLKWKIPNRSAAARLRTGASKRFRKVQHATMMIWKALTAAESHWRILNRPDLLQRVLDGQKLKDGNPSGR